MKVMFLSRITLAKENPQVEFYNKRWENDYEQDVDFMNHERIKAERAERKQRRDALRREAVERFEQTYRQRRRVA